VPGLWAAVHGVAEGSATLPALVPEAGRASTWRDTPRRAARQARPGGSGAAGM